MKTLTTAQNAQLEKNAQESKAELIREGYELVCTAVAGLDSGTTWVHPSTGDSAEVTVRNGNLTRYADFAGRMRRLLAQMLPDATEAELDEKAAGLLKTFS